MKLSAVLEIPSIRILLYIHQKGEIRYSELMRVVESRGTLSINLKELEEENLIKRRVEPTKPIQSYYSLSAKGVEVAKRLEEIKKIITSK